MNDKKNDKIKFSEKKDDNRVSYEAVKKPEEQSVTADDKKTKKLFKNVSGNN